ncbi:MAG: archease [Deltaproteobacteria bacterium]|nr:archease [Deltaproteobacteria bacterium]
MTAHAFEQEPESGEVRIHVEGETLEDVFVEAARALSELIGSPTEDPPGPWQHVIVDSVNRDALLVAYLNDLVERSEIDHLLYAEVLIESITPAELRAQIRGVPIAQTHTHVKIATMHGLRIGSGPGGLTATVVLEVAKP